MKFRLGIIVLLLMLGYPQSLRGQQGKIQLLAPNAKAGWVAVSPDGRWIAFAVTGTSSKAPSGVYITTPDGKEVTRITQGITPGDIVGYPWWSPDSKYLLFYALPVPLGTGKERIIVASVDGKILSHRESDDTIGVIGPWRFDSHANFSSIDSSSQLAVIGLDGKEIMRSPELARLCPWPVVSPDGKTFVDVKEQAIVLLDSLTFNTVAKFPINGKISCVGWSPSGKMLLVGLRKTSLRFGQIIVLDTTGKQLGSFDVTKPVYDVQWSLDSTMLAAISWTEKNPAAGVTFYTIDGKLLGFSAMYGVDPVMDLGFSGWAPANTYTILTPQGELVAIHADGSIAHYFEFKAEPFADHFVQPVFIWSPDEKLAAVTSAKADCCVKDIRIYTVDGKLFRTLDGLGSNGGIFWSANSTSLIVLGEDHGIWLLPVQ